MDYVKVNVYRIDETTSFCNIQANIKGNIIRDNERRVLDEHDLDNILAEFSSENNIDTKDCQLTINYSSLDALLYRNNDIYLQGVKTKEDFINAFTDYMDLHFVNAIERQKRENKSDTLCNCIKCKTVRNSGLSEKEVIIMMNAVCNMLHLKYSKEIEEIGGITLLISPH